MVAAEIEPSAPARLVRRRPGRARGLGHWAKNYERTADVKLLNVSYDPTRELYQKLNPQFIDKYLRDTGRHALVTQSHGGSSRQARCVVEGDQPADVVCGVLKAAQAEILPLEKNVFRSGPKLRNSLLVLEPAGLAR